MRKEKVSVLIIGSGPSGATSALLLARFGLKALVLSKHRSTANTPRAHIFNQRAMEVLRDAGLEDRLSQLASPATAMMHTSWLGSLMGEEYGRIYAWGNKPSMKGLYEAVSPCVMSDLPQNELEPVLVQEAEALGAEFRFGHAFESLSQDATCVTCMVRDRGDNVAYIIEADYVIGADGGRSLVLEKLGLPIVGRQLNDAFNVHIKADLTHLIQHRPGSLNWILNNDAAEWSAVGNFRMVKPWSEFVVSMHPSLREGKPFEPSRVDVLRWLHQMIGDSHEPEDKQVKIEILSVYRWTINDQTAPTWQRDRVLCIGDAVHRHPPINGLGSNTCISDAFNISWKLAFVLKGLASPLILETLTMERAPVGQAIVARANEGMRDHRTLWKLLGMTRESRAETLSIMEQATPQGAALREELHQAFIKTEDEVSAVGIQMNQIYADTGSRLVIPEANVGSQPIESPSLTSVIVTTIPGYHLPHAWIARDGQSARLSTLDLCGKGHFTLLTGIGGSGWRAASDDLSAQGFPVNCYSIGFRQDYSDVYWDWARLRGVEESGVILVRPDHFVLWRAFSIQANPITLLRTILSSAMGKLV